MIKYFWPQCFGKSPTIFILIMLSLVPRCGPTGKDSFDHTSDAAVTESTAIRTSKIKNSVFDPDLPRGSNFTSAGTRLYVVNSRTLSSFDISTAATTKVVSLKAAIGTDDFDSKIAAVGNYLYGSFGNVFKIFKLDNPDAPVEVSTNSFWPNFQIEGTLAFFFTPKCEETYECKTPNLQSANIENPLAIRNGFSTRVDGLMSFAVSGKNLLACTKTGLKRFAVTSESTLTLIESDSADLCSAVTIVGERVLTTGARGIRQYTMPASGELTRLGILAL